jgi:hypothetical protein
MGHDSLICIQLDQAGCMPTAAWTRLLSSLHYRGVHRGHDVEATGQVTAGNWLHTYKAVKSRV